MKIAVPEASDLSEASPELEAAGSDVARILSDLYIGAGPRSASDIAALQRLLGITAVLSLQTERDLDTLKLSWDRIQEWYRAVGIDLRRVPIEDFSPQALIDHIDKAVAALEGLRKEGHTVYMHCTAGVNRSPSVAVAFLSMVEGMPLEDALALVTQRRPQADPYEEVLEFLKARPGTG
jgi:hypothetical protein